MPPKKDKKGDKGKGKKEKKELTPEEKKAKAEAAALKLEEARKKKVAANKARIVQVKNVEDKYSKENLSKIHEKWRKIMRVAKTEELRQDVERLSEAYDHEVTRKNTMIASMMKQLGEAEEQRETAFSKHLEILDGLMNTHHTRMKDMEGEFQANLQRIENSFETERKQIANIHEKQRKELNDMMQAMENECKEGETELRQEYEASREELKNKSTEEYNVLKISLERSIEDLERKIEDTHQAYLESTEAKTQAFKRMLEKDKVTARLIEQRMKKLLHLHESIAYRRAKISTDSREWESRNKSMKDQKDGMNKHYQSLKRKISKVRKLAHQELKAVTKVSEEIQADLRKKLEVADNILKLGDINNKLEIEGERIFPFDPLNFSTLHPSLMSMRNFKPEWVFGPGVDKSDLKPGQGNKAESTCHSAKEGTSATSNASSADSHCEGKYPATFVTDETGNDVEEFEYLAKFHNKYNKVMLDKMALDKQKKELCDEVDNLKSSLKGLLQGFTGWDHETAKKLKAIVNQPSIQSADVIKPATTDDMIRIMKRAARLTNS